MKPDLTPTLILATANKHKVTEIASILSGMKLTVKAASDFPGVPEVIEDGDTLEKNAIKKARTIALYLKQWALADDTGLEVDFLDGAPGVYSARWAGPGCSYDDNNKKLLALLAGVPLPQRSAQFKCVIALSDPEGKTWTVEGSIHGYIAEKPAGDKGFGYDPIFMVPEYHQSFAQLSEDLKNKISHRGKALEKVKPLISKLLVASSFKKSGVD
ncbi:MAG: XTP/dITP diphosphatase [Endomicrobiales bacterium]|jgi:XTP/dITP diphosphohydrolase